MHNLQRTRVAEKKTEIVSPSREANIHKIPFVLNFNIIVVLYLNITACTKCTIAYNIVGVLLYLLSYVALLQN